MLIRQHYDYHGLLAIMVLFGQTVRTQNSAALHSVRSQPAGCPYPPMWMSAANKGAAPLVESEASIGCFVMTDLYAR